MIFSRATQYAIRALAYLAVNYKNGLCPLEKIAREEEIPQPFLGKILQGLAHKRLIRSSKGLNGGFGLALPLEKITLYSIVDAIDNLSVTQSDCVLGRSQCNEENPCPLHHYWKEQNANHLEFLQTVTLYDLCKNGDANPRKSITTPKLRGAKK
jgi:Rrf2 family protein